MTQNSRIMMQRRKNLHTSHRPSCNKSQWYGIVRWQAGDDTSHRPTYSICDPASIIQISDSGTFWTLLTARPRCFGAKSMPCAVPERRIDEENVCAGEEYCCFPLSRCSWQLASVAALAGCKRCNSAVLCWRWVGPLGMVHSGDSSNVCSVHIMCAHSTMSKFSGKKAKLRQVWPMQQMITIFSWYHSSHSDNLGVFKDSVRSKFEV